MSAVLGEHILRMEKWKKLWACSDMRGGEGGRKYREWTRIELIKKIPDFTTPFHPVQSFLGDGRSIMDPAKRFNTSTSASIPAH